MLLDQKLDKAMIRDLNDRGNLPVSVLCNLQRFYATSQADYVKRVKAWQYLLCSGWTNNEISTYLPPILFEIGVCRLVHRYGLAETNLETIAVLCEAPMLVLSNDLDYQFNLRANQLADIHQLAMFRWKEKSVVAPIWSDYADRMSRSGNPLRNSPFLQLAHLALSHLRPAPMWEKLKGYSGPGVTAEHLSMAGRWIFKDRPTAIPSMFFLFNIDQWCSFSPAPVKYGISRASSVPKNRASVRYVSSEPASFMFAQLALMKWLDSETTRLFKTRVSLHDASVHTKLLSKPGMVTIDLSNASDMVSRRLVREIFPKDVVDMLHACRSSFIRLPDKRIIPCRAIAPMGNGFCFRILSLVCAAACQVSCDHKWSVYGDDIICHRDDLSSVIRCLDAFGLVINYQKTCPCNYIESCGVELYKGVDMTPFKFKTIIINADGEAADVVMSLMARQRRLPAVADVLKEGIRSNIFGFERKTQSRFLKLPLRVARKEDVCDLDDYHGIYRWESIKAQTHLIARKIETTVKICKVRETDPMYTEYCSLIER